MTNHHQPAVAVLLSTYNGEKYLSEQLDSLLQQSWRNFSIVVRDDGSEDGTLAILQHYLSRHANKLHQVPAAAESTTAGCNNLGASAAFGMLMQYVLANKSRLGLSSAYMMLCDQDDVWIADKIERQMQLMLHKEAATGTRNGANKPLLIHSDLRVVDADRQLIADSLVRFQGLEMQRKRFCDLIISNLVTGCTALLNEALATRALPIASQAIMHDWWLAMVAAAFGELVFIDEPLVDYRQHGHNTSGARQHQRASLRRLDGWQRLFSLPPVCICSK